MHHVSPHYLHRKHSCDCNVFIFTKQLQIEKSSDLVMHMLVLYANTGCKMDLSSFGYTVDVIRRMLPVAEYTPCIEEHNIHAIFRWPSVLDIYRDSNSAPLHAGIVAQDPVVPLATPDEGKSIDFLKQTGLTLSITTLGTCIYRFGKKRCREGTHDTDQYIFPEAGYTSETEQMIFKVCKHVHKIVSSS